MSEVRWLRRGQWAAHAHVDGKQLCNTNHGRFMWGGRSPREPEPAVLSPSGVPFGRVCQHCLKQVQKLKQATLDIPITVEGLNTLLVALTKAEESGE